MNTSVYFTSLEVRNVRCFGRKQLLDLTTDAGRPARWTLILGENGVGKTTLLECLTWMRPVPEVPRRAQILTELAHLTYEELLKKEGELRPALSEESDEVLERLHRRGLKGTTIRAKLSLGGRLVPFGDGKGHGKRGKIINQGAQVDFDQKGLSIYLPLGTPQKISELELKFGEYSEPLIIAYGANRLLGKQNLTNGEIDPIRSRLAGDTELYDIEEMLSTLDYASRAHKNKGPEYERREKLKKAIARILPGTEFIPTDIKILPPTLNKQKLSGVCLRTEFGELVPFSSLSLGYKTTMAWVADLAWRLLEHYPNSDNPLEEPAVVLIDEIDLHLHPRWQLRIMDDLSAVFLRTQFIATSHSPLMVQVAEKANFALLRKNDTYVEIHNDPRRVNSWRVDQILTSDLFGVPSARNEQTESLFSRRDQLVMKSSRTPEEDAELEGLYVEISKIPSAGDPQDQRAMELIRKASALLKQHGIIEP